MNAINLYINACRLVMQAEVYNKEFCMEVYKLLPSLRQSLSCTVCGKLLSEPYTPTETLCQHHVCKNCIGNKKRLKPSCSWCKNYDTYVENSQIKLVIQCFIKLCSFMKKTGIICNISKHLANGGHCSIREIVDEVISKTEDANSQIIESEESDTAVINTDISSTANGISTDEGSSITILDNIEYPQILDEIKAEENEELDIFEDCSNQFNFEETVNSDISVIDNISEASLSPKVDSSIDFRLPSDEYEEVVQEPLPVKSTNTIATNAQEIHLNSNHMGNIRLSSNLYENETLSSDVKMSSNSINNINFNIGSNLESIKKFEPKVNFTNQNISIKATPSTSSLLSGYNMHSGIKQISIYNPILDTSHAQTISPITQINTTPHTTVSRMFNVPSSAIFNKQNPIENSSNDSLMTSNPSYSVMYCDSDNTKITFKRKPPDIENMNNSEQFKLPQCEIVRKIRPKPKQKPKRKGCRCGNATPTPGKLTCCGQRCPCYVAAKACIECQCRGCRNPHRPGGKKVRPIIPQFENIKIHQIQPVHPHPSIVTTQYQSNLYNSSNMPTPIYSTATTPLCNVGPTTIRTLHAVPGIGPIHAMSGGLHHLINIGSRMVDPSLATNIAIHQNQELAMKQINLTIPSLPTQYILNDDRLSKQPSDINDIDVK